MRCAEVVPQGTFSCGVAAIHLVAPYGKPLYYFLEMKKWRMDDRLANSPFSILHFQFSIIYQPNEPNGLENP